MTPGASAGATPSVHVPVPAWVPVVTWACLVGLVILVVFLGYRRWRRNHRPKTLDTERAMRRWVASIAGRWPWDAQNLGLVLVDDTTRHRRQWWTGQALPPKVYYPQIQFQPAPTGCGPTCRPCPVSASTR